MDLKIFLEKIYSPETDFHDIEFQEKVIFDIKRTLINHKTLTRCDFLNGALFNNLSSNQPIHFVECKFDLQSEQVKNIDIGIIGSGNVRFDNCTFNCEIIINAGHSKAIIFGENCVFNKGLHIHKIDASTSIIIQDSKFKEIQIIKSTFKKISFSNVEITDELFFSIVKISEIIIGSGLYKNIRFNKCFNFQSLKIHNNSFRRDAIKIEKLIIPEVELTGYILIQGATIGTYNISPFNDEKGRFKHQNLTFTREVIIKDSDISNVQFNEIDFSRAKICLDNTYLSDAIFSNILWPKGKEVIHYSETGFYTTFSNEADSKTKNLREKSLIKKEIYRQLKNSSKAESNNIDALDFYRNEMSSYWAYIKRNKNISRSDRLLVRLSKWAGDFGLSYTKPLKKLIALHSILFSILVFLDYQDLCFTCRDFSWYSIKFGFGEYVYLLNPIHNLREGMDGWMIAIDFLMRIINGFFIYHFIRATRKFAKL